MLILLLISETVKLKSNWLNILLSMVLQVEAESICALTIFDFPNGVAAATPKTQCLLAPAGCFGRFSLTDLQK